MKGSEILQSTLLHWAQEKGDAVSLIETKTDKRLTYAELLSAVAAMQRYVGTEPQIVVSLLTGGIVDSVVWLACLTGGHLHIPLSPNITDYEYERAIADHAPDIVIADADVMVAKDAKKLLSLLEAEAIIDKGIQEKQKIDSKQIVQDGNILLFTSGSTGEPKGVMLDATQLVFTADHIRKAHQLTSEDRGLTPLPFYHVNAPVVSLLSSLLAGSIVIIAPKYSTTHFWEWVEQYDPTWISIVPTMVIMLLNTDSPASLGNSSLRFIRTASAPLPQIVLQRFEEKFGIPLIETYGISEAGSTIAVNPLPPKKHKPGSVGFPIGVQLRIVKSNESGLADVQKGEIGEVWIKGENVINHYEKNAGSDSFQNEWFSTGDLGYFDIDGYLFLVGRKKEVIIRGGENIIPREIEEVLLTFPGIAEVAVVGQADEVYGEKIVAFIVLSADYQNIVINDIQEYIGHKLSPQKIPTDIHILDTLPRGNTGKIDKKSLRNREV